MKLVKQWALGLVVGMMALGATAATIDVGGVKMEDATEVRGAKLVLNGAGVRYKAVFKVYAAGLYLGKKAATPEEVLATPGIKRMQITMLRDIDSNELGKLFTRGVQDNAPKTEMSKLVPGLIKMGQLFSDQKKLLAGDVFTIDWVPGTGAVISVKGVPQGEPYKEQEFFNALMRIWLGPEPADWKLKDALLGKAV
ncbi:chalcone isomerase family protein [Polaromonas sp. SM01]|uniref:chalcone isomerase family protein n=1 Tax=Polaromonas sp. SM01 TaxID=3085630 RepID=UPI00298156CB|nr:chalcone isomerase family protein [Polaromonas sp. SM01]MDW5441522.1 chalcone isomerase family protein [Polaromonas sp. SM01]